MNRSSNAVLRQIHTLFDGGPAAGLSDGQLLERFVRRRDEGAFAALVARHGRMVLGVCRRVLTEPQDAEDAFQATFLVLVRKAGTVARGEQVGNWLYGVAHRTALEARTRAARRRAKERRVSAMPWTAPPEDAEKPDLRQLLDEELGRLPERYRAPLVLCALEGRSRAEAARSLGLPEGTVSSRLSRARGLLRERLARRGLVVPAGALAAALAREATAVSVPEALAESTVDAAISFAAGTTTTAGAATATAVTLAEGVLKMMTVTKIKWAVGTLACGLVLTAGVVAQQPPSTETRVPTSPDASRLSEMERKLDRVLEVLGAVRSNANAVPPPPPVEVGKGHPTAVITYGSPAAPVATPPLRAIVADRYTAQKSEAQRLSEVEERVTRIEQQLAQVVAKLGLNDPPPTFERPVQAKPEANANQRHP